MFSKSTYIFLFILYVLGLCSCSHYYYAPDEGNLIALKEKDDLKFSAALPDGEGPNYSLQLGYSPIKRVGLQGSYYRYAQEGNYSRSFGEGSIGSIAIGAYHTYFLDHRDSIRKNAMRSSIMFDLYAGYGKGNVDNYYAPGLSSHFDFNKKYIQLGIHWQNDLLGFDLVSKLGILDFEQGSVIGELDLEDFQDIENLQLYDTYFIRETSFRFFIGIRQIRCFMTITRLNSPEIDKVRFIDQTFQLGAIIDIDELFK